MATSPKEILGTWQAGSYFIRFDSYGTFRQAHALDRLDSQPNAISSYRFEGTEMVITEVSVSGVPTCGKKTGRYEIQLLESGNIRIVTIKEQCGPRAGDTAREYEPVAGMINPGDKIGDFLITTGIDEEVTYVSKLHCPFEEETSTESCEIPVGTKVNVSNSFYDPQDRNGAGLDAVWARHTYEMSIDGRPVNLEAFGPIDTSHPMVGKMRSWNVVVLSDKPGTISIKGKAELDGETVEMNVVLTFVTP